MGTRRLPHRLHRRRRPRSPTVAWGPMIWIAALTSTGTTWPYLTLIDTSGDTKVLR